MKTHIAGVLALAAMSACAGGRVRKSSSSTPRSSLPTRAQPWAQGLAITGDRVTAIGDSKTIESLGRFDHSTHRCRRPHCRARIQRRASARWHRAAERPSRTAARSRRWTQIADAIKSQVAKSPEGRLIQGEFAQKAWENPQFTRAWLDTLAPNHPVRLTAFTGHGMVVNSRALALIGIDESAKDPEGGRYGRDAAGRLDGRLEEYAGLPRRPQAGNEGRCRRRRRVLPAIRGRSTHVWHYVRAADGRCAADRSRREGPRAGRPADAHQDLSLSDAGSRRRNDGQQAAACRRSRHR